jgi:hypothetical protein
MFFFNWELIDNSNSQIAEGSYGNILEDTAGAIWVSISSGSVAKTNDGYHWDIYNNATIEKLPNEYIRSMRKDGKGNIVLLYTVNCSERTNTMCSTIVRVSYNGSNWNVDSIQPPSPIYKAFPRKFPYCDTRGDIWMISNYTSELYRYIDFHWVKCDPANSVTEVVAEDPSGMLYLSGSVAWLFTFDPNFHANNILTCSNAELRNPVFSMRSVEGKKFTVNYRVLKPGNVSLCLYSLQGKLIKILVSGYHQKGAYCQAFNIDHAPGVYFVRFNSPDGDKAIKTILR